MKNLTFIIIAGLMALGLMQCKKNEQPANLAEDGDRVSISLKIENVGQKISITEDGALAYVNFDNGDVMYVGSDGKYVGYLTYTNGLFSGSISAEATEGEPLQFIMMGGRDFHGSLTENLSTECTFSLSDQSTSLAVVSTEASNEPFSLTNLSYTSYLRNKCALVKFDLGSVSTDADITLTGMKNEVTVGFDGTMTNGTTTGDITTNGTGSTRYAIVLSDQEAVTDGSLTAEGYEGTFTMPAAYTNAYLTNASMSLTLATPSLIVPEGAIQGLFTINANGDQVYFSQGNLQYIGNSATPYWQFAEHQWDYLGNNGQGSTNQTVNRDLFGWATSGYNHNNTSYQPWATNSSYSQYYAYGNSSNELYDQTGQADWGYNAISNGGNQENSGWRTLNNDEWGYVFKTRTDAALKYGHGKVNGVNGMILLPDVWTLPQGLSFTAGKSAWTNVYNSDQWVHMEANGAVFLPAAGYRGGTSLSNVGSTGGYWSSSHYIIGGAYYMWFFSENINSQYFSNRSYGYSVRLVRNAE